MNEPNALISSAVDQGEIYDDIVIGSSPLMLLQAGFLAQAGRKVCLVERETRLGGAWQTATLETGQDVEIACHLIECFPGIYDFLESASGVPFVPLDAQPVRIHSSGLTVPYFSRLLMLASGGRLIIGWAKARIKWGLGYTKNRNQLLNFNTKLSSYLRHQLPAFVQSPTMKAPQSGFVDFMENLLEKVKTDGVEIRCADITSMKRDGRNIWLLTDAQENTLQTQHIHCTTSTNLRAISPGHFQATAPQFERRFSLVVSVPNSAVHISQTYVAFWNDPIVARISRIDTPQAKTYQEFLIEFHDPDMSSNPQLSAIVQEYLLRAEIISTDKSFDILGQVDCLFTANINQLPAGEIDTNLWGYFSSGNLAAGVAAWRKSDRLPTLIPISDNLAT